MLFLASYIFEGPIQFPDRTMGIVSIIKVIILTPNCRSLQFLVLSGPLLVT